MTFMPPSPRGRTIARVEGDPRDIQARGREIAELGQMMIDSATILQRLSDGTHGLRGLAVDALVEGVGDVHETMRLAGEMYTPTGPVVEAYGVALATDQPSIDGHVAECESLWSTYIWMPGTVEPHGVGGFLQPEEDSPEAQEQAAEDAAKLAAYQAWEDEAARFDTDYDSWESAFEAAAASVGDVLDDSIEDSFLDDLDGFVAGALQVLQWVGIGLAIASILIGGPIVALLAGIVALATLALTVYQFTQGDADGWDLGLAIFGVIPFGSLSKVFTKPGQAFFGGVFSSKGWFDAASEARGIFRAGAGAGGGFQGIRAGWTQFVTQGEAGLTTNAIARFFTGKGGVALSTVHPVDILAGMPATTLGRINTVMGASTGEGLYSRIVDQWRNP